MEHGLDPQALLRDLRRFWSWWTGELRACIPFKLRERLAGPRSDIRPTRTHIEIICRDRAGERHFREDKALATLDESGWDELARLLTDRSARIILAPRDTHCFTLDLPRRSGRNLPATIALQMEFASPIEPSQTAWSWTLLDADRERVSVLVAQTKDTTLRAMETLFAARGLQLPPVYCDTEAGLICVREGERVFRSDEGRRNRRALLASLAMIAILPIVLLAGAHLLIARNEAQLSALRREIAPKVELDRQTRQQMRIWQAWDPISRIPPASIILGDLGRRVPDGGSIEKLAVANGRDIRFDLSGIDTAAAETMVSSEGLLSISGPMDSDAQGPTLAMRADMP